MTDILVGAGVLAGIALVFGLLLMLVNKVFHTPSDPRRDAIREALPGANCGACSYAGCDALADAIAAGDAKANACPVGGVDLTKAIAEIIGGDQPENQTRQVATVNLSGYGRSVPGEVPICRYYRLYCGNDGQRRQSFLQICLPGPWHLCRGLQV